MTPKLPVMTAAEWAEATRSGKYRDETCGSDIFFLEDEEDVVCASALCATLITIS